MVVVTATMIRRHEQDAVAGPTGTKKTRIVLHAVDPTCPLGWRRSTCWSASTSRTTRKIVVAVVAVVVVAVEVVADAKDLHSLAGGFGTFDGGLKFVLASDGLS